MNEWFDSEVEFAGKSRVIAHISCEDGVVAQEDLGSYESHRRGKNWVAIVAPDRSQPGGLSRVFLDRPRQEYVAADFEEGDILEIASDYTKASGKKSYNREYVLICQIAADTILAADVPKPSKRAMLEFEGFRRKIVERHGKMDWEDSGLQPMRRFGPIGNPDLEQVPTPTGEPCAWCEEPIEAGDSGVVIDHIGVKIIPRPHHRECFLRSIVGSMGDKSDLESYVDVAIVYSTFLCDNFKECGNEIMEHPTVSRDADDWSDQIAQYVKEQGWLVADHNNDWVCLCPECREKEKC